MDESSIGDITTVIPVSSPPLAVSDNRRPYEKQLAIFLILASTIFERLAFYSLAINLVVVLKSSELKWNSSTSTTASFIFFGASYIFSLIFAVISDAKLGRAKTIIIGFLLYFIGYIMIILIANTKTHTFMCTHTNGTHTSIFSEQCGPQIIGILVFIAIGIGAVQANMAVFGAEQSQQTKIASRYFDKYYVAVNIGATISTLSISLIETDRHNQISSNDYFYGYLISIIILIGAAILFIIGYRYYIHILPYDTIIMKYIPVIINAFQTRRNYRNNRQTRNRTRGNSLLRNLFINRNTFSEEATMITNEQSLSFLDYANVVNHGNFNNEIINDIKSFQRAIIVFLLLIPYWIIYYQMQITFPLQGQRMKIPILYYNEKIPISWMSLGDSITIILGITISSLFVYKYLDTRNRIISIKIKLAIGMILASLAMCITGTIEILRQQQCIPDHIGSNLSIFFQLPQYICMGLAEIFATVASLEFAYLAAPRSGQSLFMSLQFCSLGFSSFIGNGYYSIYSTTNNFNFSCTHYNKWTFSTYFFILAGIQIAFMAILILCEKKFQILKINPQQIETYQFQRN